MQFECIRVPALYNYHLFNLDINVGIKNKLITKARIVSMNAAYLLKLLDKQKLVI